MKSSHISWILEGISAVFIVLFAYAGASKLLHVQSFKMVLEHSVLAAPYACFLSFAVPIADIVLAANFLFSRLRRFAFLLSALMLLGFTVYIGIMLLTTKELPCSCGGVIGALSWKANLLFNIFFLALAVLGIILSRPRQTVGKAEHP